MDAHSRKIHIALLEGLHKKVRIRCACEDISIQCYVAMLIEREIESLSSDPNSNYMFDHASTV